MLFWPPPDNVVLAAAKMLVVELFLLMKRYCLLLGLLAALPPLPGAPVPAPEKLLPRDTLAFMTVPDMARAEADYRKCAGWLFWQDPALKPFKDKFLAKFNKDITQPFEKELGIKFADYLDLARGQLTLAVTRNDWEGQKDQSPGFLLLLDAKEKSEQLAKNLAEVRKKWVDAGKQIKTEKIRNTEFTTLIVMSDDLRNVFNKVFPDPMEGWESLDGPAKKKKPENKKIEIIVGQSDTLLIVGGSAKDIEKIMALQSGGGAPALADSPQYQADHQALFRRALVYGWVNLKSIIETATKSLDEATPDPNRNPLGLSPKTAISALGLNGLNSAAFAAEESPEGSLMTLYLGAQESGRKGLLKILSPEAKDAGPAPFVPADATKFNRWRLDLKKAWAELEKTLNEISPALLGTLTFFETAIKQQDPNFDLRKNLIENLGDDIISYEKAPERLSFEALTAQPTLFLLASPDPEKLLATVKALSGLAAMGPRRGGGAAPAKPEEREFLGRKIVTMPPSPQFNMRGERQGERRLNLCANAGYLAISYDSAMLEEYLRHAGNPGKPLRDKPGLTEAAQKVGGMNTGLFGYENQAQTMRILLEVLKKDSATLQDLITLSPIGSRLGMAEDSKVFKEWFDFSLLPDYSKISKYFDMTVFAGAASADGLTLKFFTPRPPQLKP